MKKNNYFFLWTKAILNVINILNKKNEKYMEKYMNKLIILSKFKKKVLIVGKKIYNLILKIINSKFLRSLLNLDNYKMIRKKILLKFTVSLSFFFIICFSTFTIFQYISERNSLVSHMEKNSKNIISFISLGIGGPIYNMETEQIENIINSYFEDETIAQIEITNENNEIVGAKKRTKELDIESLEKLVLKNTINFEGKKIGEAKIVFSKSIMNTELTYSLIKLIILNGFVAIVILIVNSILLKTIVLTPIQKISEMTNLISDGDFTVNLYSKSHDEIGNLSNGVQTMLDKLSEIILKINSSSKSLVDASSDVSSTVISLSDDSNRQAASLEEITSSLEEIGATISSNANNSRQTNEIAKITLLKAEEGKHAVEGTVEAMRKIFKRIKDIEDIAYQTNLLALNAAIEAARAGNYGRGFTVVAQEVRKLAEKSKIAAKDITKLTKESLDVAELTGTLFHEMLPKISQTAQLVDEITNTSEEQDSGVNQINIGMSEINTITQQNAESSTTLAQSAELLSKNSTNLFEMIKFFKLKK